MRVIAVALALSDRRFGRNFARVMVGKETVERRLSEGAAAEAISTLQRIFDRARSKV